MFGIMLSHDGAESLLLLSRQPTNSNVVLVALPHQSRWVTRHFPVAQGLPINQAEQSAIAIRSGRRLGVGCEPGIDILGLDLFGYALAKIREDLCDPDLDVLCIAMVRCTVPKNCIREFFESDSRASQIVGQLSTGASIRFALLIQCDGVALAISITRAKN